MYMGGVPPLRCTWVVYLLSGVPVPPSTGYARYQSGSVNVSFPVMSGMASSSISAFQKWQEIFSLDNSGIKGDLSRNSGTESLFSQDESRVVNHSFTPFSPRPRP